MSGHVLLEEDLRALNDTATHDEESRVELCLAEILEERSIKMSGQGHSHIYDIRTGL